MDMHELMPAECPKTITKKQPTCNNLNQLGNKITKFTKLRIIVFPLLLRPCAYLFFFLLQ